VSASKSTKSAKSPRASESATAGRRERTIYAIVRVIPRGRVATYGEIAKLAGMPSGHRIVARAMRVCPESLPWHRVIGKKDARRGQIAIGDAEHAEFQRARLEAEGVEFSDGFIPLRRFSMFAR
jgi:methylated-DNA-protein-cysteine methyltransferase-like protein